MGSIGEEGDAIALQIEEERSWTATASRRREKRAEAEAASAFSKRGGEISATNISCGFLRLPREIIIIIINRGGERGALYFNLNF